MQQQLVHLDFLLVSERRLTCGGTERRSVNIGQYAVGHALAVLLPGQAILPLTLVLIPGFAVDKQHGEVDDIEVRQEVVKPCRRQQQPLDLFPPRDFFWFPSNARRTRFLNQGIPNHKLNVPYCLLRKANSKHSQYPQELDNN